MPPKKAPEANLTASYFGLRSQACALVAEYEAANTEPPRRLLLFAGLRRRRKQNRGPRPVILPALLRWFVARGNDPATYQEVAEGVGLRMIQVRNCISKGQTEYFERAGDMKVGDKLYAKVRLSAAGLAQAERE